jgi:F-type H+-transporting ATPase subunit b
VVEDGGQHGSGFPPFNQTDTFVSQVFWLVVTFGLLYFAATTFILPKVRKALADREGAIKRDIAEAAAASAKADAAAKALEARIAEAKGRARDSAAKAKLAADKVIASETAKVEADLGAKLAAAEKSIAEVRTRAMANVSSVAEDAAAAITEKLAGARPSADVVKKAVASVMSGG